jgi:hypothetical protein
MSGERRVVMMAVVLISMGWGTSELCGQENAGQASVLHIQHSESVSKPGFPQFLYMYRLLDGAQSQADPMALTGTISLKNFSPNFSEVLWLLAYWRGKCPVDDHSLEGAIFLWSDILKNPSQSLSLIPCR